MYLLDAGRGHVASSSKVPPYLACVPTIHRSPTPSSTSNSSREDRNVRPSHMLWLIATWLTHSPTELAKHNHTDATKRAQALDPNMHLLHHPCPLVSCHISPSLTALFSSYPFWDRLVVLVMWTHSAVLSHWRQHRPRPAMEELGSRGHHRRWMLVHG